jgi:hypothetical protein
MRIYQHSVAALNGARGATITESNPGVIGVRRKLNAMGNNPATNAPLSRP